MFEDIMVKNQNTLSMIIYQVNEKTLNLYFWLYDARFYIETNVKGELIDTTAQEINVINIKKKIN